MSGGDGTWTRASDLRLKKEIEPISFGLDFINELNPVKYKFKQPEDLDGSEDEEILSVLLDEEGNSAQKKDGFSYGLIAQEVKSVIDNYDASGFSAWSPGGTQGVQGVSVGSFVIPIIKAVQELSAKVDSLEARILELE